MGWNHRVMKHKDGEDDFFTIHEVYYNKKGKVDGYTIKEVQQVVIHYKNLEKI